MGLHVLHAVSSLEPEAGSVAISLRGLFCPLRAADVTSTVVTLDVNKPACEHVDVRRFDPHTVGNVVEQADVVHFHGFERKLVRSLAPAAHRLGKPYVISPLGALSPNAYEKIRWSERVNRWMRDRKVYRNASTITVLNEKEATDLRRDNLNGRVLVLPYGIDFAEHLVPIEPVTDHDGIADKRCLLMLGPIHPVEGIVLLLRVIAELGHDFRGWHVILAGPERDAWRAPLEAAIQRKGFSDRITFLINPNLVAQRACMARSSLLLAPSLCIRLPCSVQQAVAAGVPVLASDHGLPSGIEGAVRVCTPNQEILRESLRKLISLSDEERAAIASKARRLGERIFSWEALAPKYVQLYSQVSGQSV